MSVVRLEEAKGGNFFLCEVEDEEVLGKLLESPSLMQSVFGALSSLGHVPHDSSADSDLSHVIKINLNSSDVLSVGTLLGEEMSNDTITLDESADTAEELSLLKSISINDDEHPAGEPSTGLNFDDIRSPPKKRPMLVSPMKPTRLSCRLKDEVQPVAVTAVASGSCVVKVKNIAVDFIKAHFVRFIRKLMSDHNCVPEKFLACGIVICCSDHDGESVEVQFTTPDLAASFCELVHVYSVSYEDAAIEAEMSEPRLSKIVEVSGLAEDFIGPHLVRHLNAQAMCMGVAEESPIVLSVTAFNGTKKTANLKFTSVEAAKSFCNIAECLYLEYEEERLRFKQLRENSLSDSTVDTPDCPVVEVVDSPLVLVENLPEDFIESHFLRYVLKQLIKYQVSDTNERVIVDTFDVKDGKMKIEFSTASTAKKACNACSSFGWTYEMCSLCMTCIPYNKSSGDDATQKPIKTNVGKPQKLSEYETNVKFLKILVRLRHLFTGRNHDSAYARIFVDLEREGLSWDVATIKKQRKSILDTYNRRKRSGTLNDFTYALPCAVLQGDENASALEGTDFAPDTEINSSTLSDIANFTKGAVWTVPAIQALIAVCTENRETYLKDTTRHSSFFRDVSAMLVEMGHFYDGGQCERKMGSLKKEYKDEVQRLGQTGAAAEITFPHYDLMAKLMEGDVSVHPERTMAAGSVNKLTIRDVNETGSVSQGTSKGVTRAPALRRPRALSERKVSAIETIAIALKNKYSP